MTCANGVSGAQCLAHEVPAASYTDSRPVLPDGVFYYLVRVQSECGTGSYGFASSGAERHPLNDCP